jgi:hypothetical protein
MQLLAFFSGRPVGFVWLCTVWVKNKKASVARNKSQTWLALVCSLDRQYPLIRLKRSSQ